MTDTISRSDAQPEQPTQPTADLPRPHFCPRPTCPFHDPTIAATTLWFKPSGSYFTKARGTIPIFRCLSCKKYCSTQTFSIHYWTHFDADFKHIENQLTSCSSLRQMGRQNGCSFSVIRNRIRRLARQYLTLFAHATEQITLPEPAAFDGFESFLRSQYFPTNYHLLIGSESQMVYAINATVMRRKGRMTPRQKQLRARIDQVWRPKPRALEHAVASLFTDLSPAIQETISEKQSWVLATDQKKEYPRALSSIRPLGHLLGAKKLIHRTVSSRAARTGFNPLWPVNYMDRELRKDAGEHVRETVKFAREMNSTMDRMVIQLGAHSFAKPFRITGHARIEGLPTHADKAGLTGRPMVATYREWLYTKRNVFTHVPMRFDFACRRWRAAEWIRQIWQRDYDNPPIIDPETGEKKPTGQPKERWFPQHLLA